MLDYGKLAYLGMHKTGSTTITTFLGQCCTLEKRDVSKHAHMQQDADSKVFYMSSVRNPIALYLSLFRFGCDGKGHVFRNMEQAGKAGMYAPTNDAFKAWVDFMTTAEGVSVALPKFTKLGRMGMGMMAIRHYIYSVPRPVVRMRDCITKADIEAVYAKDSCVDFYLRNEFLNDDLQTLATNVRPAWFDQEKTVAFFADAEASRTNASKSGQGIRFDMGADLEAKIKEKDALLFDRFYAPEELSAQKVA